MKIGILSPDPDSTTGWQGDTQTPRLNKMLSHVDAEVHYGGYQDLLKLDSTLDLIIVPEWAGGLEEDYETWTKLNRKRFSTPTVFWLFNSKISEDRYVSRAIKKSDLIWTHANFAPEWWDMSDTLGTGNDKQWIWLPFCTYEDNATNSRSSTPLIMQGRHHVDTVRTEALLEFLETWDGGVIDFATRDTPEELKLAGLWEHPKLNYLGYYAAKSLDAYNRDVMIETASEWWGDQPNYGSDRPAFCIMHNCTLVTNHPSHLNDFESTRSLSDFKTQTSLASNDEFKRDYDMWDGAHHWPALWEQTASILGLGMNIWVSC